MIAALLFTLEAWYQFLKKDWKWHVAVAVAVAPVLALAPAKDMLVCVSVSCTVIPRD